MTAIYETKDGQEFEAEDVKRKSKCDFCGETGNIPDGDDFIDGDLPSLHGEGIKGDYADICRNCLINGVSEKDLENEIGDPEELREKEVELA